MPKTVKPGEDEAVKLIRMADPGPVNIKAFEAVSITGTLVARTGEAAGADVSAACLHCGTPCVGEALAFDGKRFCCQGCRTVFELLMESGLGQFYQLSEAAGVRVREPVKTSRFAFLDEPGVRARLVDFADARLTRITFQLPAIHCVACVWLLENLFRLRPGIGQSQVNFARKEAAIAFDPAQVKLSEVAALLASLGYEPELKFADLEAKPTNSATRRLWLQLGVAGFAFGNAMFFAITGYFGLDAFTGPQLKVFIGCCSPCRWSRLARRITTAPRGLACGKSC